MMRKILLTLLFATAAFAKEDLAKISEAMGHLIGKNLESLGLPLDIDALVKGMQDEASGKEPPLNEDECVQAIASLQEDNLSKEAVQNLEQANLFLQNNREKKGIVSLENGKLQYEILKEGQGQPIQPYNKPLIRYKGSYLNGEAFGDTEELITLDESIDGFNKGVIGMHEQEKRILYIHPDLGYGKEGYPHPNSLLIFEVEVVKADASSEAKAASNRENFPNPPVR